MKDQAELFEPIKKWLESKGFKALITGDKSIGIVIPVKDLLPTKPYIVPDLIGIKDSDVAVVEVETDADKVLGAIGKCMLLKTTASFVYLAYPEEQCQRFRILEKLGIGLLSVSAGKVEEVVEILPKKPSDLFRVGELHLLDPQKQSELAGYIKRILAT
ncbi:MAG: hypothetical protein M1136_10330 [Chloroflexi bacterium]|nr:hypothetical protein [Chloroflexota bacterium]MCL5076027.1 hypothetical protein [Chloroflexota bacterium]